MELKVGDKIYFFDYGKYPIGWETIIKKTPTMFKTKNYSLKVDDEYIHIVGLGAWNTTTAKKESEANNSLWEEQKIINWFDNKVFTVEEKKKIYEFLKD